MDWKAIYRERLTTAEEAVRRIQSGDRVATPHPAFRAEFEAAFERRFSARPNGG